MPDGISPAKLESLLDSTDSLRVVDVRSHEAYEAGHIPGSENLPFDDVLAAIGEFDDACRIVTVCPHGEASVQAARLIESSDAVSESTLVQSLRGGIEAWEGELVTGNPED